MTGLSYALTQTHHAENRTHAFLLQLIDTHPQETELCHVAQDLARWSDQHVRELADAAASLGLRLTENADEPNLLAQRARSVATAIAGPPSATRVLQDLAELYLRASDTSLKWEMLAQIAQAEHRTHLMDLAARCHPQTLRQIRWANTMLKTQTPQVLASL